MLCSEVTVRKDEEFLRTYTVFSFCGISFLGWLCPYIFARTASERLVHSNRSDPQKPVYDFSVVD